jgi:hypothetical protein
MNRGRAPTHAPSSQPQQQPQPEEPYLRRTRGRAPRLPARSGGHDCTRSASSATACGAACTGEPSAAGLRCTAGGAARWLLGAAWAHMGVQPGGTSAEGAAKGSKLLPLPKRTGECCCRREGQLTGGGAHAKLPAGLCCTFSSVSPAALAGCQPKGPAAPARQPAGPWSGWPAARQ